MDMFARFDETPATTLQDVKETKCEGQTWKQYTRHEHSLLRYKYMYALVLLDFLVTVKAAPHECVIRTGQP